MRGMKKKKGKYNVITYGTQAGSMIIGKMQYSMKMEQIVKQL